MATCGIWAIPGDIAPDVSVVGTLGGIQNTFSNLASIGAPIVTGVVVSRTGSYDVALWISSAISIVGALAYWFIVTPLTTIRTSR